MRGLDPRIHPSSRKGWIAGSSPAMTDRPARTIELNIMDKDKPLLEPVTE